MNTTYYTKPAMVYFRKGNDIEKGIAYKNEVIEFDSLSVYSIDEITLVDIDEYNRSISDNTTSVITWHKVLPRDLTEEEVQAKIAAGEPYVIRLRLPENHVIKFNDLVRGETEFNTNDLDDQVLIKTDGFPTYHFAVVVDDHLMEITHVIRGEEWLSSTPKHVYLYEAFGWEPTTFVFLPNMFN